MNDLPVDQVKQKSMKLVQLLRGANNCIVVSHQCIQVISFWRTFFLTILCRIKCSTVENCMDQLSSCYTIYLICCIKSNCEARVVIVEPGERAEGK